MFWELHGIPEAEPYKAKIERAGLWIDIDLPSLIETVHISPAAEPWLVSVIQEATAKYDLHIPVVQSALTGCRCIDRNQVHCSVVSVRAYPCGQRLCPAESRPDELNFINGYTISRS